MEGLDVVVKEEIPFMVRWVRESTRQQLHVHKKVEMSEEIGAKDGLFNISYDEYPLENVA